MYYSVLLFRSASQIQCTLCVPRYVRRTLTSVRLIESSILPISYRHTCRRFCFMKPSRLAACTSIKVKIKPYLPSPQHGWSEGRDRGQKISNSDFFSQKPHFDFSARLSENGTTTADQHFFLLSAFRVSEHIPGSEVSNIRIPLQVPLRQSEYY